MSTLWDTYSTSKCGSSPAAGVFPSRPLLLKWLLMGGVIQPDGSVLSWKNPDHAGFPYPEAAGVVAACLMRENGPARACRRRIARHLMESTPESGGFGKNGILYVFDTAVILSAMVAARTNVGFGLHCEKLRRMFDFAATGLESGVPRLPQAENPSQWSDAWGCHLLKAPAALLDYARRSGGRLAARAWTVTRQAMSQLLPLCDGRRFRIHAGSTLTYAHAHCYAVEGLLSLAERGLFPDTGLADNCAEWLADVQRPDGGIPPWHDGVESWGEPRGDATAQAVSIWRRVNCRAFAANISAALAFLAHLQTPEGGLRYCPSSADVNTWVTAFAFEALRHFTPDARSTSG